MEQKKLAPKKRPPKELPAEMPPGCVLAVFLGGYCDMPAPRNYLLKKMLREFRETPEPSLANWKEYVKVKWPDVKRQADLEDAARKQAEANDGRTV